MPVMSSCHLVVLVPCAVATVDDRTAPSGPDEQEWGVGTLSHAGTLQPFPRTTSPKTRFQYGILQPLVHHVYQPLDPSQHIGPGPHDQQFWQLTAFVLIYKPGSHMESGKCNTHISYIGFTHSMFACSVLLPAWKRPTSKALQNFPPHQQDTNHVEKHLVCHRVRFPITGHKKHGREIADPHLNDRMGPCVYASPVV